MLASQWSMRYPPTLYFFAQMQGKSKDRKEVSSMEKQESKTTIAKVAVTITPYEGSFQAFSLKSGSGCGGGSCSGGGSCGKCGK